MTAAEVLDSALSRGAIKRLGRLLDNDPALMRAVVAEAGKRGVSLPEEAAAWPGKRLIRHALGRSDAAQERSNPIARDEAFTCVSCKAEVGPSGRSARDHCPRCLHSLHVDLVPGDRAETCGGVLMPIGMHTRSARPVIEYRCRRCGVERMCQALLDVEDPDDWGVLVKLSSQADG
jgi:predicted RNA-binding Zn-ribbon protein involved in translation (DUF1610 family)